MTEARHAILITGASAGIGEAFARAYAARGFDLVLSARRLERLEALCDTLSKTHGIRAIAFAEDLADPEAPERLINRIELAGITLGGLVNNAGYGPTDSYVANPWRAHADFIQVMVTAPCHLTHLVLPGMLERRHGRIINVASLSAFLPGTAEAGLYGATKSFMVRSSEALNSQYRGSGVHITAICPGLTHTEFHDVAGLKDIAKLPGILWMTADAVAERGIDAADRNDAVYITGGINKIITFVVKHMPNRLARRLFAGAGRRNREPT